MSKKKKKTKKKKKKKKTTKLETEKNEGGVKETEGDSQRRCGVPGGGELALPKKTNLMIFGKKARPGKL